MTFTNVIHILWVSHLHILLWPIGHVLCFSLQLSRARGMGGGLNHLSLLLEFT